MDIVIPVLVAAVAFAAGYTLNKILVAKEIRGAETEAERIVAEAGREAETIKREALLEGRDQLSLEKAEMLEKHQERRVILDSRENKINTESERLSMMKEKLEERKESLDRRETGLSEMENSLNAKHKRVNRLMDEQNRLLEKTASLSREEARKLMLSNLEEELHHEAGRLTRKIIEDAENRAEEEAMKILATAVQRYSADHVVENCVSVVNLPSDDMKGRIIGREGRNIRAFEKATNVDVIIDDTPEAVVISCFDPVRREIARQSMEKLLDDGRIHPGRIESTVSKVNSEMKKRIRKLGNQLALDANVSGLHQQLIRHLGRLRYRTSYGQNMYQHSMETSHICGLLAAEMKLDPVLARRIGLLHDIGKSTDQDIEGSHAVVGMELAQRYEESQVVCNAIGAHHEEVECESLYAVLLQAADSVSSARPGARKETLELYVRRLHKLESIADSFDGVRKSYAIQAGRELRIAVKPERVDDDSAQELARIVARKIESDMEYPGQIRVTVIRETRASETAH
ncbi:MAG: ribonuclease Y [Candidatus Aegiribacteria sp.]|nr:ribonuclease Y [Candidatus Aegiribacteria sp.]MBD3295503.1 ribonuclease Y [Candidatus Fermentibacteria bacterium]